MVTPIASWTSTAGQRPKKCGRPTSDWSVGRISLLTLSRLFNSTSVALQLGFDEAQPDRIKLPKADGSDGRQATINQELKDMAAQTFKQIATACAILVDRASSNPGSVLPGPSIKTLTPLSRSSIRVRPCKRQRRSAGPVRGSSGAALGSSLPRRLRPAAFVSLPRAASSIQLCRSHRLCLLGQ